MTIEPGEIDVWRTPLDEAGDESLLDDDERARAARFRSGEARRRFTASHVALRRILALYDPGPLRFGKGQFGKPSLRESRLRFSMAHSGDIGLVAVALEAEVGVDIECISSKVDVFAVANRFFPPEEAAAVAEDPSCFFRLWTRREAYLKALGVGLTGIGLPAPAGYFIRELEVPPGYAAAVACEKPGTVSLLADPR